MDNGTWQATVHGTARVRHDLATNTHPHIYRPHCLYETRGTNGDCPGQMGCLVKLVEGNKC